MERTTVAHAEPGLLAHFPDVVALGGGRLPAVWREGAGHARSAGRIRVAGSGDGGLTWPAAAEVVPPEADGVDFQEPTPTVVGVFSGPADYPR